MKYSRNGHFDSTQYCVVLQANELLKKKLHHENVTLCVYPQIEKLPTPAPLRSDGNGNKKTRKITENIGSLSAPSSGVKVQKLISIEYPSEVSVLQNASYLARVVEPKTKLNDANIR